MSATRMGETVVYHGDCLDVMTTLAAVGTLVDSIVTDPPYHLTGKPGGAQGFMGKEWDGGDIAFRPETWRRCYDLLKPGGYLLAFSASRTYHRMACAIEDAGFDIRDQLMWLYGTGFPKSHDVSKALDKMAGVERAVVTSITDRRDDGTVYGIGHSGRLTSDDPITDAARQWEGWGTALKPAHEPIVMARKPLDGTVAANVLKHGVGAINIDACRVGSGESRQSSTGGMAHKANPVYGAFANDTVERIETTQGRFPANVMLSYAEDEYQLRSDVTETQRRELYRWLSENT